MVQQCLHDCLFIYTTLICTFIIWICTGEEEKVYIENYPLLSNNSSSQFSKYTEGTSDGKCTGWTVYNTL